jgi:hypothetical protein
MVTSCPAATPRSPATSSKRLGSCRAAAAMLGGQTSSRAAAPWQLPGLCMHLQNNWCTWLESATLAPDENEKVQMKLAPVRPTPAAVPTPHLMSALLPSVWLHRSMPGTQTCAPSVTKLRLNTWDSAHATSSRLCCLASSCWGARTEGSQIRHQDGGLRREQPTLTSSISDFMQ